MPEIEETRELLFLPGATGASAFWLLVAERLPDRWQKTLLRWPGAGDQPHDPRVRGFEDLVELAAAELDDEGDLIAQSIT